MIKSIMLVACLWVALAEEPKKEPPPIESLQAKVAYLEAQNEALKKQLQFEFQACWNMDIMSARFEAAQAAKKAEALKPPEEKKK